MYECSGFSTSSPTLLLYDFWTLEDVKWYFVFLVCTSLMTDDVEHFLLYCCSFVYIVFGGGRNMCQVLHACFDWMVSVVAS